MVTKKPAPPSYEAFGDDLNAEVALWQAASAIDVAAVEAITTHNIDKLMDVAAMWIGLAERLASGFEPEEDDEVDEREHKHGFGFSTINKKEEEEEIA